jgi:hypothetical protein
VARNGLDARTDYSVVMMCLFATSSPDVGTGVSRLRWTTPRGPVPSATSPGTRSSGVNTLCLPIG